ncbi:MAG: hypothetical protein KGK12_07815 [Armatimonadetes bacterium]|nr:hypothetical protein [Armatimonadota bacterium]
MSAGVPAQVLVGATINFTLLNPVGAPINLSTNSALTNSCGQAIVTASGSAQGVATLQASWTGPDGTVYTQAGDAYCLTATTKDNSGPDGELYPPLTDLCDVWWASESKFTADIETALENWYLSTWGDFYYVNDYDPWNILYFDQCDDKLNAYANTTVSGVDQRSVEVNTLWLDPCATGGGDGCLAFFPPASARHHLVELFAHETGHALGLAHTTYPTDRAALMWPDISNWFLCGTDGPEPDETMGM